MKRLIMFCDVETGFCADANKVASKPCWSVITHLIHKAVIKREPAIAWRVFESFYSRQLLIERILIKDTQNILTSIFLFI